MSCGAVAQSTLPAARQPPARAATAASAALPAVNLWVELRQVDEVVRDEQPGRPLATTVGTRPTAPTEGAVWSTTRPAEREAPALLAQLRLQNGGQAQASWHHRQPVEWVSSAWAPTTGGAGPARPAAATAGLSRELHWLPAGREITVSARWPGGNAPVSVELVVDLQSADAPSSTGLPPGAVQARNAASLFAPLDQWVTVARSAPAEEAGAAASPGSLGTRPAPAPAVLLQLRVRAGAPAVPPPTAPRP